jgi:D-glycero-alpha-D-manno-heptose-7-phosphate kinase
MIISRTPFRVSFLGGGTDYPAWFREQGGAVLAATIDKFCYLTCRYLPPFFEHRFRVVYSKIENRQTIEQIEHAAVRETLRLLGFTRGVEIHHDGDLPARSGMGSSSAFTVGLLNALHALRGEAADADRLARESIHLEQDVLEETVGCQDQLMAAHGGLNHIEFTTGGEMHVRPLNITPARSQALAENLMLFYTGIRRTASDVAASYVQVLHNRRGQLEYLAQLVDEGLAILSGDGRLDDFGKLLHAAWLAKSSLSKRVTNSAIDEIYSQALAAGAVGGKLLGAGGGGFLLLYVPPDVQPRVKQHLDGLVHVPFAFTPRGSEIIFHDAEQDYAAEEQWRDGRPLRAFRELSDLAA